jgi:uncharacterized circularly permuted ATP-grasp superfamily protein
MTSASSISKENSPGSAPAEFWNSLLRSDVELQPEFCANFSREMRSRKLTFGDRVHCPFLRPFFLSEQDEARVRKVAESIAVLGEQVVRAALESPDLLKQLGLSEAEERLVRLNPGYATASTASRLDAFLLPNSIQCAEYNAESPAGLGYAETLAGVFKEFDVMRDFQAKFVTRTYSLMDSMLAALLASYKDWGGTSDRPQIAIVDWREVPTWSEFQILRDRFEAAGVPTLVCDPRDLSLENGALHAGAKKIDLVYRRVLINDILARSQECAALVKTYETQAACVANTFQCKIPHKKAFFAVLTDERNAQIFSSEEHALIHEHIPWTRVVSASRTTYDGKSVDLVDYIRANRERLVIKPNDEYGGAGVILGWESDESRWDGAIDRALKDPFGTWVVQERISVRREVFPFFNSEGRVTMKEMLVDLAPYLFRGKLAGFLTRLSATSLANVTSGGGQVPSFVVSPVS